MDNYNENTAIPRNISSIIIDQFPENRKEGNGSKSVLENSAPKKIQTVAEFHEAARIGWKKKLENKSVYNENEIVRWFGCRAKCEEWVYGKNGPPTESISK